MLYTPSVILWTGDTLLFMFTHNEDIYHNYIL